MGMNDVKLHGPQLAEEYEGASLTARYWMEPKYDGARVLVFLLEDGIYFYSRNGKPFFNTEWPRSALAKLGIKNAVIDGESYAGSWEQTQSILRTQSAHPDSRLLRLYAFDLMHLDEWNRGRSLTPQDERRENLELILAPILGEHIALTERIWLDEGTMRQEIFSLAQAYLDQGREGGMLKRASAPYICKRNRAWLKMKFTTTHDCKVLGIEEGEGRCAGTVGAVIIDFQGEECKAGTGLTDSERDRLWAMHQAGTLVGRTVEVKIQEVTPSGSTRFPVYMRLRDDK